jgi:hypothetical protein
MVSVKTLPVALPVPNAIVTGAVPFSTAVDDADGSYGTKPGEQPEHVVPATHRSDDPVSSAKLNCFGLQAVNSGVQWLR